ncbi:MAG: hypothetical protein RIE73_12380 [Coleofasciculus sp. C1-SOL-03]|jgi:hypothetical protein|uniref:hypothetical protein n=1 Tax=Coleofasciculus sp. C1-SOL-03 TaxID=3069522 RepID=UPI0033005D2E
MICSCKEFQKKYPDCTVCSHGKKITAQENKRKYILNNPSGKQVCKVKIDDCVIKSQEQRKCDYLVIICQSDEDEVEDGHISSGEDLFFVELKGKDLIGAVEQLTQTIEHFKSKITGKVFARVVLSKVPSPKSIEVNPGVIKLRKLLKKYSGNFAYSSRQHENDTI